MEKREPSYTAGGNVNRYNHRGEQYGDSLKKLNIELPYDQQSHSWAYTQTKTIIQKDTHTPMFIEALFTMAKIWKQPKCPSTDE